MALTTSKYHWLTENQANWFQFEWNIFKREIMTLARCQDLNWRMHVSDHYVALLSMPGALSRVLAGFYYGSCLFRFSPHSLQPAISPIPANESRICRLNDTCPLFRQQKRKLRFMPCADIDGPFLMADVLPLGAA